MSYKDDTNKKNIDEEEDFEPIEEISTPVLIDEVEVKNPGSAQLGNGRTFSKKHKSDMTGQVAESKRESLIAETLPSTQFFSKFNRIAYLSPVIK